MEWMLDIQLGRRNLSPIQRIAVAEKYRPIYERQALLNKSLNGGDKKSESKKILQLRFLKKIKLMYVQNQQKQQVYLLILIQKEKKILDSDNEDLKNEVLSGEKEMVRLLLQMEKK